MQPHRSLPLRCGWRARIPLVTALLLDGKTTAAAILADLTTRVGRLAEQGITPGLGTVLIGDDPGSRPTSPASSATAPR